MNPIESIKRKYRHMNYIFIEDLLMPYLNETKDIEAEKLYTMWFNRSSIRRKDFFVIRNKIVEYNYNKNIANYVSNSNNEKYWTM